MTVPPLAVGSRLSFVATFLGRHLAYTYEIRDHVPGERLVMSTSEGPFPMETTYIWEDTAAEAPRCAFGIAASRVASPASPRR